PTASAAPNAAAMGRSHTPLWRLNPLSATKSATRTASQTTKAVITRYDLASVYAFPWASNASRDIPRAVERLPISMPWISSWRAIDGPGIGPRNAEGPWERAKRVERGKRGRKRSGAGTLQTTVDTREPASTPRSGG